MFEFFDEFAPENLEQISQTRVDRTKTSVLSKIENDDPDKYDKEELPMKKHFAIKPFLIAAAVAVTGAVGAVSAGAAENTNISDLTLPKVEAPVITEPHEVVNSEVMPDISYYYGNDPYLETEPAGGDVINVKTDERIFKRAVIKFINSYSELQKDDHPADDPAIEKFFFYNTTTREAAYDVSCTEFELLYEDTEGVRHYENSDGEKFSVSPITIDEGVVLYFWDNAVPEGDLPAAPVAYIPADIGKNYLGVLF